MDRDLVFSGEVPDDDQVRHSKSSVDDFPQLMPWMVFVTLGVILANLFADVLYAVLDPRIRLN
jgi:ABC-type microcin C transport system permease subunit YejB